ncbi:MBL fold metallo-hydrolase [Streptomyces sp. TRM 70351]|uniref:MBL fold metallo-hydrolase n=1 Tax=Streptomyces sp. TRM 70351 TaxID=3116552 RepID=UPI002E7AC369|nr:MBL fold metallo-hydrolase [Streptomyces sp. TRM 70351]MEE1928929.1 MBL fold metallo-hydrolase [Streptomyces sp. TRM 70351]
MPAPDTPVPPGRVRILFAGNATLLLRYGPLTLLTDPNFLHRGEFAYLGKGLVSRRLTEPALGAGDLPGDLDAVVLSHLHGDHFDRRARRALPRGTPVVTTPHAARRLQGLHGFSRAVGLRTWQEQTLVKGTAMVRVTAVPGRHAGSRLLRAALPPVMGSVLEFGPAGKPPDVRLYLSGDTLVFDGLREVAHRFRPLDVAAVHLGGTLLAGRWLLTMDAGQGARFVRLLQPRRVLPVHYEEYGVMRSPLADFLAAAERDGFAGRLLHCRRGEAVEVGGQPGGAPPGER